MPSWQQTLVIGLIWDLKYALMLHPAYLSDLALQVVICPKKLTSGKHFLNVEVTVLVEGVFCRPSGNPV